MPETRLYLSQKAELEVTGTSSVLLSSKFCNCIEETNTNPLICKQIESCKSKTGRKWTFSIAVHSTLPGNLVLERYSLFFYHLTAIPVATEHM